MDNFVTRAFNSVSERLGSIKHPILTIIVIGLILRLILSVFTVIYDSEYWSLVIRNIKMGEGLYGVTGYYYTPVWGYLLGLLGAFQSFFLDIGEMGIKVVEFAPAELNKYGFITSIAPSLILIYSIKIPLIVCDLLLAFASYVMAKEFGLDEKRSILVFALVFLCPIIMYSSAMVVMPDVISALFMVLTIILLKRRYNFIAGICLSIAILTKFFPVFLFFPLVAYVLATNKEDNKTMAKEIGMAAAGFVLISVILFLPQIMTGDISKCFVFLTDRSGGSIPTSGSSGITLDSVIDFLIGKTRILMYLAVIIVSIVLAVRLYKDEKVDLNDNLIRCCFIVMMLCMLYPPTEQYIVVLVPFLAYWICAKDKKYIVPWTIFIVSTIIMAFALNTNMLLPWAAWTDIVSVDALWNVFSFFNAPIGPTNLISIQYIIGGVIQYIAIFMIFWMFFGESITTFIKAKLGKNATE